MITWSKAQLEEYELGNTDDLENILTFQSKEVVDILKSGQIYKADINLSRERHDYIDDIKQLNGSNPIWGFRSRFGRWLEQDLEGGVDLRMLKYESGYDFEELSKVYMIEIVKPRYKFKVGLTHNASHRAIVFEDIKPQEVIAIYQVDYVSTKQSELFPSVKVIEIFQQPSILEKDYRDISNNLDIIWGIGRREKEFQRLVDKGIIGKDSGRDFTFRDIESTKQWSTELEKFGIHVNLPTEFSKENITEELSKVKSSICGIDGWEDDIILSRKWVDITYEEKHEKLKLRRVKEIVE